MRLRFSLASLLMVLLVALLTVLADWPHADLHVCSLREAVGHSAPAAEPSCSAMLAGALSLVLLSLLSLPASPALQMKLCPWRGSLPTKTTEIVSGWDALRGGRRRGRALK